MNVDFRDSLQIGDLKLSNRVVMAPLTRRRCPDDGVPSAMNIEYYAQRASAGLIIAEATNISPYAKGYPDTPGIFTERQINGWSKLTEVVHNNGGLIFIQLWHTGRFSHPKLQPNGERPMSASSIAFDAMINTGKRHEKLVLPREMTIRDIIQTVKDFKNASKNAKLAGFDGIEIHGANGYLIDQFLQDGTNHRSDDFGGDLVNRFRFLKEILEECIADWGNNRVGLRLSPSGIKNGMSDSNATEHFFQIISLLNSFPMAYLHLIEPLMPVDNLKNYQKKVYLYFRKFWKGTLIANGNISPDEAGKILSNRQADLIAFGRLFISNPDLVYRLINKLPLNDYDSNTFYGGDNKGYTDYPFYKAPS